MSSKRLENYIILYKTIYSKIALILGLIVIISGCWLGSLGYQLETTGWLRNVFGCKLLYNENNLAPSFFIILSGLLVIIINKYRIKINLKPKEQINIDHQALRYKFIYSTIGLAISLFSMIFGIVLAENGGNLCPTDWATKITSYDNLFFLGVIFFFVGIIILIITRYRIRI